MVFDIAIEKLTDMTLVSIGAFAVQNIDNPDQGLTELQLAVANELRNRDLVDVDGELTAAGIRRREDIFNELELDDDGISNLQTESEVWKTIAAWPDTELRARLETLKKDRAGLMEDPIPTDRKAMLEMLEEWEDLDDYVGRDTPITNDDLIRYLEVRWTEVMPGQPAEDFADVIRRHPKLTLQDWV